jgi:hypothetical protein
LTQNTTETNYNVANLGRIMSFETWTNTIGLLGHAGVGLGFGESQLGGTDRMGNFMAGVTGQIKLSNRLALTGFHDNPKRANKIVLLMVKCSWNT